MKRRITLAVVVLCAALAPAAQARPAGEPAGGNVPGPAVVHAQTPAPASDGFAWGDAAIGAGAALVLMAGTAVSVRLMPTGARR